MKVERVCLQCSKHFYTYFRVAKYCSIRCSSQAKVGVIRPAWRRKVARVCLQCGTHFKVKPSQIKYTGAKFCSPVCVHQYYNNPKHRRGSIERICQQCGAKFFSYRSRVESGIGKFCSNECRYAWLHKRMRALWQNSEYYTEATRKKRSQAQKESWQNPVIVARRLRGLCSRPTKPEVQLQVVLDKHFPQFKYNGDFSLGVTLGGLIPDFVNVNGKKEVIELFGEYWHSKDNIRWNYTELGRVMAFNSVGFRCLVIWDNELGDEQILIDKIQKFIKSSPRVKQVERGEEVMEFVNKLGEE